MPPCSLAGSRLVLLLAAICACLLAPPARGWALRSQAQTGSGRATVSGIAIDARTNEPLHNVLVWLQGAVAVVVTDRQGRFALADVTPGRHVLVLSAVNYALVRRNIDVPARGLAGLTIAMPGGAGTYSETVTVTAPLSPDAALIPSRQYLAGAALQTLSGGILDDPSRAVQALPGVTTGDDFRAEFAVRGHGPRHIGGVFEGVATSMLMHTWHQSDGGTASMINSDVVAGATLMSGAYPQRQGNKAGALLDITMREGPRDRLQLRGTSGLTMSSAVVGGPLGSAGKGSYLASIRLNYLDTMLRKVDADMAAGFRGLDSQGKLVYDLSGRHQVQAAWLAGRTTLDMDTERPIAGPDDDWHTANTTGLLTVALRSTFGPRAILTQRAAAVGNRYRTQGFFGFDLARETRKDASYRLDLAVTPFGRSALEAGIETHRLTHKRFFSDYDWAEASEETVSPAWQDRFDGTTWRHGAYALFRWDGWRRLTISPGARVDHSSLTRETTVSPWLQVNWMPASRVAITLAGGVHHQFPDIEHVAGQIGGGTALGAERAVHADLGLAYAIDDRTKARVSLYNREDRGMLRLRNGEVQRFPWGVFLPGYAWIRYINVLDGYARGVEFELRSDRPNGLSGWASYSLGYSKYRDVRRNETFPGDYDQRHTVNLFGQYRWSARTSVSGRFRYGSNYPLAGYYAKEADGLYGIASIRNAERLPAYARLDVRADRTFVVGARRLTLFAELLNVLDHTNVRQRPAANGVFITPDGRWLMAGRTVEELFPRLPTVGLLVEF